jgi:Pyruvate/2-oxoacid:ferredoxin oxidoreductase gamma subunit
MTSDSAHATILNAARGDMAFCPGCSHSMALEHVAAAVKKFDLAPTQVCFVSDIGCIGMADRYLTTHTFHGLHGRSITYAEGIKRAHPDLYVIVLIGDGGCGIGTAHLVHAARRGVPLTVVVCNNFNFGMTGGQHSVTTPPCAFTSTTPGGAADYPFDICQTVLANGASFVARHSALDVACRDSIEAALCTPGFALLDLWELCVAYFVPSNQLKAPGLKDMSERLGMPFGVLRNRSDRASPALTAPEARPEPPLSRKEQTAKSVTLPWSGRRAICVAGSAGQRIQSAAGVIGELAVAGGRFAAQQNDFPISVRRGHSISNLLVSDRPIRYAGTDDPDLIVILSDEGAARLGDLSAAPEQCRILVDRAVTLPRTRAAVRQISLTNAGRDVGKASAALALLCTGLLWAGWIDGATLVAAATAGLSGKYRDENLRAINAAVALNATSPAT